MGGGVRRVLVISRARLQSACGQAGSHFAMLYQICILYALRVATVARFYPRTTGYTRTSSVSDRPWHRGHALLRGGNNNG